MKNPLRRSVSEDFWSEWRGSNSRPPHPKCGALSTALHPDSYSIVVVSVVKSVVRHGFDRYFLFSIPPEICTFKGLSAVATDKRCEHCLCSQSRRATNCATPGYFVILFGWSYSPKAGALPTALHPVIFDFFTLLFLRNTA